MTDTSTDRPTTSAIRDRLSEEGILAGSIEPVSEKPGRFWVMYRVTLVNGETRYVRTLTEDRIPEFRSLASLDTLIDMPETELLEGQPTVLVSNPACGTPLSVVLPIFLVPGLWTWKREELRSGVRSLGSTLGTLHTKTVVETAPVTDSEADKVRIGEILDDLRLLDFDASTTREISHALSNLLHEEVIHATAHRDPSPHNVYYKSGNITLIDLNVSVRPALLDVALAEIGLELMAARLPYARKSQGKYLIEGFWKGYRSTGIDVNEGDDRYVSIRIYQLCQLLNRYMLQELASPVARFTAFTDRRIIRNSIRSDCDRLAKSS